MDNICSTFVTINIYFLQFTKIFNQLKPKTFLQPIESRFEILDSMKTVHQFIKTITAN